MRILLLSCVLLFICRTSFSQEDGYLSDAGTNGKTLIYSNQILREIVCNYTFRKKIPAVTVLTDIRKLLLTDSVTIFYDSTGNIVKRIREIRKKIPSTLVDTFYYNQNNLLSQIATTSVVNNEEIDIGYSMFAYNNSGKIVTCNSSYTLANGLIKNSVTENKYNDKGQLSEVWHLSNISARVQTHKYFYDRKGRVKQINFYFSDYSHKYKHRNHKILIYSNNPFDDVRKTELYYNNNRMCVKKVHGDNVEEYIYNADGTLAETKAKSDNDLISITQHQYFKD